MAGSVCLPFYAGIEESFANFNHLCILKQIDYLRSSKQESLEITIGRLQVTLLLKNTAAIDFMRCIAMFFFHLRPRVFP